MIELSVVIPTFNRLETLEHVIPSLLRSELRPDRFELIVADSNSTDGTTAYLAAVARDHPQVRHVIGPFTGRAMARNAGIATAVGEIVLFTDADIIASPDLLNTHLFLHHARTGIVVVGMELQVNSLADYRRLRDHPQQRRPLHPESRRRLSWLYFLTGNASVRRNDLIALGCFDEAFTGYGHEDLELGYRLEGAGLEIVYAPQAVNYHWHPVGFSEQKEKMTLAGRSTVRFYRKHPDLGVKARLGMTAISLGVHAFAERNIGLLDHLERAAAERPGLARNIVYQYHYVSGIKDALAE